MSNLMTTFQEYLPVLPEIIVAVMAMVILMADLFLGHKYKSIAYILSQLTLAGLGVLGWLYFSLPEAHALNDQFYNNHLTIVLKGFVYLASFFVFVYARQYLDERKIPEGEFYTLAMLSMLGAMVLISANSLLTIYIGLELHSLPLYAIIAMRKKYNPGSEAAIKYFILGAVISAFLLYGMSFIYGITGHLNISDIYAYLADPNKMNSQYYPVIVVSMVFFIVAAAFKLGAAPFHNWVPDVYEGSPNAVTAYLATVPKLAAYGMLVTLLTKALPGSYAHEWQQALLFMAVISIFIGNIVALVQRNIKRMFAYSTVSHIGFVFLAMAMGESGYAAALYYVVVYIVMSVAGFGIVLMLSRRGVEIENIDDFAGLNKRNSWLAFMMLIVMFSMAGIPPFAGFTSKLLVLNALVAKGYYVLTVYALLMTVVASFYYLRVVKAMYFDQGKRTRYIPVPKDSIVAISVNSLIILLFGVFPIYLTHIAGIIFGHYAV